MNAACFSTLGYLSAGLWLLVPVLWLVHVVWRPRGRIVYLALIVGVLAYGLARIHSTTYVNRIRIDHSAQIAEAQARQEKARRTVEEARGGEVAQIRFAEDKADDYLDMAGMDQADRKYTEGLVKDDMPAWKREKKSRSVGANTDNSLDALVQAGGGAADGTGVNAGTVGGKEEPEPILMPEAQVVLANRLDGLNIGISRWLCWIALAFVLLDYLYRVNVYREAYYPLPLPSWMVTACTPPAPVYTRPDPPRRTMPNELEWLIRRGDSFLYLTDDADAATAVPRRAYRLPFRKWPADILRVADDAERMDDEFIFEALWYGRASFVVDSGDRAEQLLARVAQRLRGRKDTRARVRQTTHIVWDSSAPIPPVLRNELVALARATGFSLMERTTHEHE